MKRSVAGVRTEQKAQSASKYPAQVVSRLTRELNQLPDKEDPHFKWTTHAKAVLLAGIRAGLERAMEIIKGWRISVEERRSWGENEKVKDQFQKLLAI